MQTQAVWHSGISHEALLRRARLLAQIREFFALRQVLEVDVPTLGLRGASDPHIDSLVTTGPDVRYLQTSPEYFLKRLLAGGCGPVYSLAKAFRAGDRGRLHNPEFTLLEWYRPGWDEYQLMDEIADLLANVGLTPQDSKGKGPQDSKGQGSKDAAQSPSAPATPKRFSYRDIFLVMVGVDPHTEDLAVLRKLAGEIAHRDFSNETRATCLDVIFSFEIEARLPSGVVFVEAYPACLSALAQLGADEEGTEVARRFEVFLDGVELANGYFELCDGAEQRRRFAEDNRQRKMLGKAEMPLDEKLLAALDAGLPSCAGVALGVDRLLMRLMGAQQIDEVIAFADGRP